jgi:putative addiction module CopG family antidote
MADSHQLSVTLPDDLANQVRARVASGKYASESDVVAEALRTLEDREHDVEHWLRTEAVAIYDRMKADPSRGRSLDEVRASLAALHECTVASKGE